MNNSKWISNPQSRTNSKEIEGSLLLRKSFIIEKKLISATVEVAGLGYGVYTLNGKGITDDVLSTPFTAFDKRVIYNVYDITEKIRTGENVFGAFLGNGWYNDVGATWNFQCAAWRYNPKLAVKILLFFEDGTETIIGTDSSWKVCDGPCVFNHLRQGEIYDARLEKDDWDMPGADVSNWENAIVVRPPGGVMEPMNMPPIRIVRTLEPIGRTKEGYYDFGENISGWARIILKGETGREVVVKYGELINDDGEFDQRINLMTHLEKQPLHHENRYILKGKGVEEYAPKFCYHGFRYVSVENAPKDFKIVAEVVHTDLKTIGFFKCSDRMLNLIHEASVRSTLTNYHSIPTDCPHREENGWTADAMLSSEQALMNFDLKAAYKKWMNDFKDVQRPNGQIPGIIPTSAWGYNWGSGPAWDVTMLLIPWNVYQNTGDTELIVQMWDNNVKYFEYMNLMSEDYIVDYGLGDWCPPPDCKQCPTEITDTAYFFVFADTMAKCAQLLGKESQYYIEKSKRIRESWRKHFLNRRELEECQTYLACAVYQGLLDEDECVRFAEKLAKLVAEKDYHIDCGILGTKYIFTVLSEYGYADVLYKMVTNPTMPSYTYWINQGMTTFCENWQMGHSCNHHMFSEVDNWFYKYLAGIRVSPDGVTIKPVFINEVSSVSASHRGISVDYNRSDLVVKTDRNCRVILSDKVYDVVPGTYKFTLNRS
ncbi:MAG: family 78 glycoside hydrolase catalytic domain [Clostridia bacterium]|nr:family 78 glycoside hydrolase catalytic domain [Clostridia bacterium]